MGPADMHRRRWIALATALGWAALALFFWHRRHPSPPRTSLSVLAYGPCANGTALLLSDLLELQNRRVILPPGAPVPEGMPRLLLRLSRSGASLIVDAELDGHPLPRQQGTPLEAVSGLARALGLEPPGPELLPPDPADGWILLDLMGRTQDEANAAFVAEGRAFVLRHPDCAAARLAWGNLLTRYLVEHLEADTLEDQAACEQNFRDALASLPAYPRLTALFCIHLTDIGRQREALQLLAETLRRHPGNAALLNALAYTARTSGLLAVADRALERRGALLGVTRGQSALADNTLLYSGRYRAFAASLDALPEGPLRSFYQGYARLLMGDREEARKAFATAKPGGLGSTLFVRLAEVYRLALEGREAEAAAALDRLESERMQIHLPDGEYTFKLAEAHGFLGHTNQALEVAERASFQGFGCADWFERAPFLEGARRLPRWVSLDTHLRERQRLLAEAFPPSAFGL